MIMDSNHTEGYRIFISMLFLLVIAAVIHAYYGHKKSGTNKSKLNFWGGVLALIAMMIQYPRCFFSSFWYQHFLAYLELKVVALLFLVVALILSILGWERGMTGHGKNLN